MKLGPNLSGKPSEWIRDYQCPVVVRKHEDIISSLAKPSRSFLLTFQWKTCLAGNISSSRDARGSSPLQPPPDPNLIYQCQTRHRMTRPQLLAPPSGWGAPCAGRNLLLLPASSPIRGARISSARWGPQVSAWILINRLPGVRQARNISLSPALHGRRLDPDGSCGALGSSDDGSRWLLISVHHDRNLSSSPPAVCVL
jgi:hypothetical protein